MIGTGAGIETGAGVQTENGENVKRPPSRSRLAPFYRPPASIPSWIFTPRSHKLGSTFSICVLV